MSAENLFAEVMQSEEDKKEQQKIEQVKRHGYKYFKLIYIGGVPALQMHIQGLHTIEAYKTTDENGNESWSGRPGAEATFFREDSLGQKIAMIWDDPEGHNRAWCSTHIGFRDAKFRIDDETIEKEILSIKGKRYKVELGEEELLEKQIKDAERRLVEMRKRKDALIEKVEEKPPVAEQKEPEPTPTPTAEPKYMIDETGDVDGIKLRGRRKLQTATEEVA